MLVSKELTVAIDLIVHLFFQTGEVNVWLSPVWSPTFFKITYFVFNVWKKLKQLEGEVLGKSSLLMKYIFTVQLIS